MHWIEGFFSNIKKKNYYKILDFIFKVIKYFLNNKFIEYLILIFKIITTLFLLFYQ
jgi:hypothetical protein